MYTVLHWSEICLMSLAPRPSRSHIMFGKVKERISDAHRVPLGLDPLPKYVSTEGRRESERERERQTHTHSHTQPRARAHFRADAARARARVRTWAADLPGFGRWPRTSHTQVSRR